jgi:hypothetical protein
MDERFRRVERIEQRVQMLVGAFASHGVLPLEFTPAYSMGDPLLPRLEALEQEAEEKGGRAAGLGRPLCKGLQSQPVGGGMRSRLLCDKPCCLRPVSATLPPILYR